MSCQVAVSHVTGTPVPAFSRILLYESDLEAHQQDVCIRIRNEPKSVVVFHTYRVLKGEPGLPPTHTHAGHVVVSDGIWGDLYIV